MAAIIEKISPVDAKISVDYIVQQSQTKSILQYDQAFEFSVMCIGLDKPEGSFDFGDTRASRLSAIEKWYERKYHPMIQDIASRLPKGLTLRVDGKENRYAGSYTVGRVYDIYIGVSAEFSKKAFEEIATGNVVHLSAITPAFLKEANEFKEKVLSTRRDVLGKMLYDGPTPSGVIYIIDTGIGDKCEKFASFSSQGLKGLANAAQRYGFALAIIEHLGYRGLVRIKDQEVVLETRPPFVRKTLADW